MNTIEQLRNELAEEYQTTKKFLQRFPEGKDDYAPHPKSSKLLPLAGHITEVFGWPAAILTSDSLDLAQGRRR